VRLAQQPFCVVERIFPRDLLESPLPNAAERVGDSVVGVEVREGEAALVAEPALVDLGVVAREDPLDLALALVDVDVAADRAEAADARDGLELPGPNLEPRLGRQQSANGAGLVPVPGDPPGWGLV